MHYIGNNVRHIRERLNWKQSHLAQKTNLSQSIISHIETNQRPVSDDEVLLFAKAFDTNVDELLTAATPVSFNGNNVKGNAYLGTGTQMNYDSEVIKLYARQIERLENEIIELKKEMKEKESFFRDEIKVMNASFNAQNEKWLTMINEMYQRLTEFLKRG
jgi:transcriptional regulator with XRE-family HTH domain